MLGITTTNARVGGFRGGVSAEAKTIYNRIIADGGVSNLTRLNFFVKGLKAIYGDLANVPVCYDAHWIGYKLGSGTGATAGQAAAKLYSLTVAADAVQATAASQPLLLAHNGASSDNYWYGSGVSGNLNTSSLQSAFNFGGDFSMVFDIKPLPTISMEISGCLNSIFYSFAVMSTGVLRFNGGGQTISSTSGINTTIRQWVRISRSGNNWLFYTSIDGTTWTQLGTTVVNSVTLSGVSINIRVGEGAGGIASLFNGSIFRGLFYTDATLSTTRADFNPAQYNASTSQTQWTSSTGEVWTISTGTATSGYKSALVSRTIVQGDGVDDKIIATGVALANNHTNYCAYKALVQDASGNRVIYSNGTTNFVNSISAINTNNVFLSLSPVIFATVGTKILNTLGLTTSVFGTNATRNKVNNGTFSSPLTGVYVGGAGISLFGMPTIHFANSSINTMIVSSSDDSLSVNTATYELIKSLNESAF